MSKKFSYFELFSKLKFVVRYSGVNMIQPERLESHIIEMIGLAFDLHYGIGGFDLNKIIYLIAIHDVDEAVTVDIPRPFKYFNEDFRQLFNKTVHNYFKSLGVDEDFLKDSENAKELGLEGKILRLLDLVQVQRKLQTEMSLGNSNLQESLDTVNGYINSQREDKELTKYINYLDEISNA